MEFILRDMSDEGYYDQEPVILLIDNKLYEATFESSRGWFYTYNNIPSLTYGKTLDHIIYENDPRIKGWCSCKL